MGFADLLSRFGSHYLDAWVMTVKLTAISFTFAFIFGVIFTIMRISPIAPLRWVGEFCVQVLRNIPGISMLIILVYAFPYLDLTWPYFVCVLIVASLIPAAFASENLMSGINTIAGGQIEAARSLGMTFSQIVRTVIIPQALRSTVLPMTSLLVGTMLTTSLASQVPLKPTELTGIVDYINTRAVGGITAFLISAACYVTMAVIIGQLGSRLDRAVRIIR